MFNQLFKHLTLSHLLFAKGGENVKRNQPICGVYQILNLVNGKRYIGISKDCELRWQQHKNDLVKNKHKNVHLQRAWNTYGELNFEFSIIDVYDYSKDRRGLLEKEIEYIAKFDSFKNGYNRTIGGDGSSLITFSDERNRKISAKLKGRKYPQNSGKNSATAKSVIWLNTGEIYDTIVEASEKLNVSEASIIRCCQTYKPVIHHTMVFAYYKDYLNMSHDEVCKILEEAENYKENCWDAISKSVICLNNSRIFASANKAAKEYKTDLSYLHKCCKGLCASAGKDESGTGLAWMYLEDYNNANSQEITIRIQNALRCSSYNKPIKVRCITTSEAFDSMAALIKKYKFKRSALKKHLDSDGIYGTHPITGEPLKWEIIG